MGRASWSTAYRFETHVPKWDLRDGDGSPREVARPVIATIRQVIASGTYLVQHTSDVNSSLISGIELTWRPSRSDRSS